MVARGAGIGLIRVRVVTTGDLASRSAKEPNGWMIGFSLETFARSPRRAPIPSGAS